MKIKLIFLAMQNIVALTFPSTTVDKCSSSSPALLTTPLVGKLVALEALDLVTEEEKSAGVKPVMANKINFVTIKMRH